VVQQGMGDAMSDELITVFMVTRPDYGKTFCVYRTWGEVYEGEFENAEDGEIIHITMKSLTKTEVDNLPEFEGW
jgi:hypothetical protein